MMIFIAARAFNSADEWFFDFLPFYESFKNSYETISVGDATISIVAA